MKRTRTFIALDPGKAIRDRLVALQEDLAATGAALKWVERENLHVTLLFLGEVAARDLVDVCRVVGEAAALQPSFPMTIERAGAFPALRRPRTVWIGIGIGATEVVQLHDALEARLLDLGCYRREARAFEPHLTLGRVKGERAPGGLSAELIKHATWSAGETLVREVLVMGSELMPDGPVYTVLSRAKLGV
jgi:2'-5' RNA ligase